ncbi:hypothetical protein [Clostridium culturomicium]|uniref:hypothetical protein n=1 Tax=Clostridium culturomicium TaxID=1499683 RepID=UPI0005907B01|nr:hypothetical protein [Clostridium culturomicium]
MPTKPQTLEEVFNELLPLAVRAGISINNYWELTYGEICIYLKAYNDEKLERTREQASLTYRLADLIGASVARLLDSNSEYPSIDKAFPGLFDDVVKEQKKEKDWSVDVARFMNFAMAHNKKFKK